jgi:hypothetical protein
MEHGPAGPFADGASRYRFELSGRPIGVETCRIHDLTTIATESDEVLSASRGESVRPSNVRNS